MAHGHGGWEFRAPKFPLIPCMRNSSELGETESTARKEGFSTCREPPVCTGFPTGTAPPVQSTRVLSTGQLARY